MKMEGFEETCQKLKDFSKTQAWQINTLYF